MVTVTVKGNRVTVWLENKKGERLLVPEKKPLARKRPKETLTDRNVSAVS